MAKDLSEAAAVQAKIDSIDSDPSFKMAVGATGRRSSLESLVDLENQMRVEDWEFSSPHAISKEYMESHQDVVSAL